MEVVFTYRVVDGTGTEIASPVDGPVAVGPLALTSPIAMAGVIAQVVEVQEPAPGQSQGTIVVELQ